MWCYTINYTNTKSKIMVLLPGVDSCSSQCIGQNLLSNLFCHGHHTAWCFFLFHMATVMFLIIIHNTYLHHTYFLYTHMFYIPCILLMYIDMWPYMFWYNAFCSTYIWYICIQSCLILWFTNPSLIWQFDLVSSKVPQIPVWPPVRLFWESPKLFPHIKNSDHLTYNRFDVTITYCVINHLPALIMLLFRNILYNLGDHHPAVLCRYSSSCHVTSECHISPTWVVYDLSLPIELFISAVSFLQHWWFELTFIDPFDSFLPCFWPFMRLHTCS